MTNCRYRICGKLPMVTTPAIQPKDVHNSVLRVRYARTLPKVPGTRREWRRWEKSDSGHGPDFGGAAVTLTTRGWKRCSNLWAVLASIAWLRLRILLGCRQRIAGLPSAGCRVRPGRSGYAVISASY